jgi:hypothetical protein
MSGDSTAAPWTEVDSGDVGVRGMLGVDGFSSVSTNKSSSVGLRGEMAPSEWVCERAKVQRVWHMHAQRH